MAISVYFNNKKIVLPGAYATIAAGEQNSARTVDWGRCMIIDTSGNYCKSSDTNAKLQNEYLFGGGLSINTDSKMVGQNAVYRFTNIDDFRNFIGGGKFWQLAKGLFTPDPSVAGVTGISELFYVSLASTSSATITITVGSGTIKISPIDKGECANGIVIDMTGGESTKDFQLVTGYLYDIVTAESGPNAGKFSLRIWKGTYSGLAGDGIPYNEVSMAQAKPKLIIQSPYYTTGSELLSWMQSSSAFNTYFDTITTDGTLGNLAVTTYQVGDAQTTDPSSTQIATGGTTDYSSAESNASSLFSAISKLNLSFIVTDIEEENTSLSTLNSNILGFINSTAKYKSILFVTAGEDSSDFANSIALAQAVNSSHCCVVHGDVGLTTNAVAKGFRWWGTAYNTYSMVGRLAGKAPQIPLTNKSLGINKLKHQLTEDEQEDALNAGLLVTVYNESLSRFVVLQGVNTLQDNEVLFTNNGESFSIQFMRIVDQINKELIINSEIDLLGQENGVNANTLSTSVLKTWTEAYLQSRTATSFADNLILSFRDVTVTKKADYYWVTYGIVVNNEINKIFFTGFVFNS